MKVLRRGPLWRKIEANYRPGAHMLPAPIAPNPLVENYRRHLESKTRGVPLTQAIRAIVCHEFNVSQKDLLGKSTKPQHAFPRQVAMYLTEIHAKLGPCKVARIFGKDHTCIGVARRRVTKMIAADAEIARRVDSIRAQLQI